MGIIIKHISPLLRVVESKFIKIYASRTLTHQPIFIIGAPRTGSTILYQMITNQLDVLYIDNLICKFYRNLFFGFWLSQKLYKNKAHNCFNSKHGNTEGCGLHAPSECGDYWYQWLPKDRHYIDYSDITEKMVHEIRAEISAIINYYKKPLVFNNNNIALRMKLIQKIFPDAKYIAVDRDPVFVANSILKARKDIFGGYEKWWSIMPPNYNDLLIESHDKQVVMQHYYINKQMYLDMQNLVDSKNYMTIKYSEFCADVRLTINKVKSLINYHFTRAGYEDNIIKESRNISLSEPMLTQIKNHIAELDWDDYKS